jgi:hypothetical protein
MKYIVTLFCVFVIQLTAFSQTANNGNIPIKKEDALKFKTALEALGLPPVYKIVEGNIMLFHKGDIFFIGVAQNELTKTDFYSTVSSQAKTGDILSFSNLILNKDGRRIKIMDKTYIFL